MTGFATSPESITASGSMDSGPAPRGASRNESLLYFDRSQKFLGLLTRRKAPDLFIVGLVLRRVGRTNCNKLVAILLNMLGQIITVVRRHVPRAAMRTIVVAHAGPLVGPYPLAACAFVEIEKPCHASLPSTRNHS